MSETTKTFFREDTPRLDRVQFSVDMILSSTSGASAGASAVFTFHGAPPKGVTLSKIVECVAERAEEAINQVFEQADT